MYYGIMRGEQGYTLESRETAEELPELARQNRRAMVVCLADGEKAQKLLQKLQASKAGVR